MRREKELRREIDEKRKRKRVNCKELTGTETAETIAVTVDC